MAEELPATDLLDEKMVAIYKEKTPQERLEISFALWSFARSLVKAGVRLRHPDWPEESVEKETADRMLHAAE